MRFQVLAAATLKLTAFWDIASCTLVEVCRQMRIASIIRATTRRYIPEACHLQPPYNYRWDLKDW
jgi:hypothetical protein